MSLVCPRCAAPHDGQADKLGWVTCRACANVWNLKPRPAAAAKVRPLPGMRSDEYPPDETDDQPRTAPLAAREGGSSSGGHPVALPRVQTPDPGIRPARRPAEAVATQPDIDSQLFDRLEQNANERRSQQETIGPPVAAPEPTSGTCPVCGHRFVLIGTPTAAYQTCPQCSTTFNVVNGQLATGDVGLSAEGGDFLIGRTIRGCYVDRKIGEGGMGAVYHARQLSLDRSVAIKVMPTELARNKNFIQRFEREAKSLARINHPNILHIYDFGEDQALGIYFMIIEFVDGKDLGEVLRGRDTITQEEMLDILRQALLGLEMASEKGVIHRDIKPDNLMISKDGICKVSDFGLAKGYGSLDEVTSAGVRVGTPAFMSPEQCDGADVDCRSDIYSLGCTAFLALTAHLPFSGNSPFSIMLKHKTEPAPPLRKFQPDIDPRVDDLVRQMLAKRPDDRCRTLRELIDRVEELQVSLAHGVPLPRKATGERSRSLNDSGAVVLLPEPALPEISPEILAASTPPPASSPLPAQVVRFDQRARPGEPPSALAAPMPGLELQPDPPSANVTSSAVMHIQRGDEAVAAGRASEAVRSYQEALKRRSSRDVGGKLADARKLQRHGEAEAIEDKGDQLAARGRDDEAIDEWLRASQMQSRVIRREEILRKVGRAQSRKRRRMLLRRSLGALALFLLIAVNVGLWTPPVHEHLAARDYPVAATGEAPSGRLATLGEFIDSQQPYAWYARLFRRSYELPTLVRARQEVEALRALPAPVRPADLRGARDIAEAKRIRLLAADPQIPWRQVAEAAAATATATEGDARRAIESVIADAQAALQAQEEDIGAIASLRSAGRHAEALTLAGEFPSKHPRSGLVALPRPGRLAVTAEGREGVVEGVRVVVDGVALVGGQGVFCRDTARSTVVEVDAPGFLVERRTLPPGEGKDVPIAVVLRPGRLWQAKIAPPTPWWSMVAHDSELVLLAGPRALIGLAIADGSARSVLERSTIPVPPASPDPVWTLWQDDAAGAIIASSDGIVARVAWEAGRGPIFRELARKGIHPVAAWMERELTFQPGRRAQVLVETTAAGADLVTISGGSELWRIRGLTVAVAPPYLAANDDRLCVVDDKDVRLFEEDGTAIGAFTLTAERQGQVLPFANGRLLAIPTAEGIDLVRFGGQPHFLDSLTEPALARIGQSSAATDRDDLLVADPLGGVSLVHGNGIAATVTWKAQLPPMRKPVGAVALTAAYAVVVDDANSIHLFARASGAAVRRYEVPSRPAVAPLPVGDRLLVLDGEGNLTAYYLPD